MRNLIVHRRGIVDSHYLNSVNDDVPLNTELVVLPLVLENLIDAVLTAALAMAISTQDPAEAST